MHKPVTDAPEGFNHLYKPPSSSYLSEVQRKEFRMFYNQDGTIDASQAFDTIDHVSVSLAEMIAVARDMLPYGGEEIAPVLTSSIALLCTIIPPFEALQVRFAELEQLAARPGEAALK